MREPSQDAGPPEPDIDANGVDRAQIRAMLALSPEERLRYVGEFVESALELRTLNGPRPFPVLRATLEETRRRS